MKVRDHVLQPYKTTDKINYIYIYICIGFYCFGKQKEGDQILKLITNKFTEFTVSNFILDYSRLLMLFPDSIFNCRDTVKLLIARNCIKIVLQILALWQLNYLDFLCMDSINTSTKF